MERDSLIVHGVSRFLRERLFDQSDPYKITVCRKCRNVATTKTYCKACKTTDVVEVLIPYAAKLLFQELNALGIKILIEADT